MEYRSQYWQGPQEMVQTHCWYGFPQPEKSDGPHKVRVKRQDCLGRWQKRTARLRGVSMLKWIYYARQR
jgi:hypothetical protein